MPGHTPHRGFIVLDVVAGLMIVIVLISALTIGVHHQTRALRAVRDSRQALAIAERAMADLQGGGKIENATEETRVEVEPLRDAPAPEGWAWVRVNVRHGRGGTELTGIVPKSAAEVSR